MRITELINSGLAGAITVFAPIAAYIFAAWFNMRYFIHMFQLNSYKPKVQRKWLADNSLKFFTAHFAVIAAVFALIAFKADTWLISAFVTIALIASGLAKLPKKHYKTPIKYTKRLVRMIITTSVLDLLAAALGIIVRFDSGMIVMSFMIFMTPFVILLANLINRPLEKAINRHYINDAERILRECPDLTVIGITGSFGKTSVKYFLDTLLSEKFNVLKTPGNFNTPLGVVKTIRGSLRATHEVFLCEMGAKNVGDIKEICDIVKPKHGIITSVGPMHLESFKTIENVKKTKFELADAVAENGMLFLNTDDKNVLSKADSYSYISYGTENHGGYYATDLRISEKGSEFTVHSPDGKKCDYKTSLIGRHNIINIVGAIAVSNKLGISLEELKPAVRRLESVPHRLELINKGTYSVIDDAYNSNPNGARAALEALSMTDGMKILVTPGMIELGEKQNDLNFEFGEEAAKVCDYCALVGEKQTEYILKGLVKSGFPKEKIYVADSLNDAMQKVYSLTSDGKRKIILLENDLPDNY